MEVKHKIQHNLTYRRQEKQNHQDIFYGNKLPFDVATNVLQRLFVSC
jgi:hypothetical protein